MNLLELLKPNFIRNLYVKWRKKLVNMTKMVATPIYAKKSSPGKGPMILKVGMQHWGLKLYKVYISTLVNVYVALPIFTAIAGSSYANFMEQNCGAQYVNSEFGRYCNFCWC